jgi:acetolactate decarboxylase
MPSRGGRLAGVIEEHMLRALHVESMRRADLHEERDPHVLFQASTIGDLIEGNYEGDLTFDELAGHGDLGLGTLNHLDGEMIALDGRFYRADVDGDIHEVEGSTKTPFAVVVRFSSSIEFSLEGPLEHDEFVARLDEQIPDGAPSCAVRVDGEFELVHARSVPRQHKPYRPLAEVIAEQHTFDFADAEGTAIGFRFPDYSEGIEVGGYHLHYLAADRRRGGHMLECRPGKVRVQLDPSSDLHVELPPGIDFEGRDLLRGTREALDKVEHSG